MITNSYIKIIIDDSKENKSLLEFNHRVDEP
jgi:hypothetical protein